MADPCNVPKEILESMRDVLDKRVKVSIRRLVKMEIKADKLDNRVLAFSPCRLFILTAKAPTKVESSFHFLDIQSLESKKPGQLVLTINNKEYRFIGLDSASDVMDHLIMHLGLSLQQIFPSFPLERLIVKVDIQPEDRMKKMREMIKSMESKDPGPCGGFTTMYQCMCDYHALPYREDVAWDVDTIYLSHDSRELRLQDFDHLPHKDLIPVIAALEHNTWFKSLNASNVKLSLEVCNEVIKVMRRNAVLEEINLRSTGIKTDFVQKLSTALISNSGSQLQAIDLSHNFLEDKAITHLLGAVKTLSCGLSSLDLSNTGISTRCIDKMGETMSQNASIMSGLTSLKLNDNGLKGEDFHMLYNCLAQPNLISTLDLSSTDCVLDSLCDPLLRGCTNLTHLKLSKTLFTHKRGKEIFKPQSWKQLFSSSCCLEYVDLSSCKLPAEALKELLLGMASNRNLKELHLDISSNELGSAGAAVLTSCFAGIKSIKSLDISNNGFDLELKTLLPELGKVPCLKHLAIGRNFSNVKQKHMADLMMCLVSSLLQEESALESLSLADSRLRMDTTYVINALGSNNTLVEIDISGNGVGDHGARMLAKALQINTKLQKVVWDKNGISAPGFEDVAEALKKNMSLRKMPFPVNDASASMRIYPERTESALQKIESILQRNHCPGRFAPDIAYRLQQGFLISSTQQILDRKVVQLQDSIQALNTLGSMEVYAGDVTTAENLVNDANKSRQLLPGLQDIALESQSPGNVVDQQLQSTATQLKEIIENQLKKTVEDMLKCTKTNCPTIMAKESFHGELNDGCRQKTSLPKDFTKSVLEGAATDIHNVMGEMNLAVASLISDTVIDEVIESLSAGYKTLSNHLNLKKSGAYKEAANEEDERDGGKLSVEASPQLSNKRNSMWNRKTRPQSTMDREKRRPSIPEEEKTEEIIYQNLRILSGHEAISIASTWQAQNKLQELSQENTPVGSTEMLADFGELPSLATTSKPLTHVTKGRARPPKSVRPTRPILDTGSTEMDLNLGPDNGLPSMTSSPPPRVEVPTPAMPATGSSRKISTSKEETSSKSDSKAGKQEEGGKPESKKWSPMSFIKGKNKEDKPEKEKKSHSFSSGISSIFKKKDEKKRPSVSADTPPVIEESKKDATESKDLEKSQEAVKEKESSKSIDSKESLSSSSKKAPVDVSEKPPVPNLKEKNPTPVRPPREKSTNDRVALLPPKKNDASKAPTLAETEGISLEDDKADKKDKELPASNENTNLVTKASAAPEEEDKDKKESPSEVPPSQPTVPTGPKLPPGAVKIGGLSGLGNRDLLDQLKMKQKRKSNVDNSPEDTPKEKPEKAKASPSVETNNNDLSNSTTAATVTTASPTIAAPNSTSIEQLSKKPEETNQKVKSDQADEDNSTISSSAISETTSGTTSSETTTTKESSETEDTKDKTMSSSPTSVVTMATSYVPTAKSPAPAPRAIVPPKRPSSVVVSSSTSPSSSSSSSSSSSLATSASASMSSSTLSTSNMESNSEPKKPERPLSTGPTPMVRPRPTPPLKPRPPIMPRPKKRDSEIDENSDAATPIEETLPPPPLSPEPSAPSPSSSGAGELPTLQPSLSAMTPVDGNGSSAGGEVVYDSATLRLSVKDKIKRMSQAKAGSEAPPGGVAAMGVLPPQVKKKVASLPRDAPVPERAEEDAIKEHSKKDEDTTDATGKSEAAEQDWVVVDGSDGETANKSKGDDSKEGATTTKEELKQEEGANEELEDHSVQSGGKNEIFI